MSTGPGDLVVPAMLGTATLVTVNALADGHLPEARAVLGVTVASVMLSALAGPLPQVAGPLAMLVLTSTTVAIGGPAFSKIASGLNGSPSASTTPTIQSRGGPRWT